MCVIPWRCRVSAVVRMMKNITRLEKNVPTPTSILPFAELSRRWRPAGCEACAGPSPFPLRPPARPARRRDTGEIVVPRMATSVPQALAVTGDRGDEGVVQESPPVGADVDRRDDVGEEHERQPLQHRGDLVVAQADRRPRDADTEEHDEEVRVQPCQHLGGVGHAGEVRADVDRVGGQQRQADDDEAPAGELLRKAPARPLPVTMPMRAHIIWTAAISGQVSHAVQSSAVPSCAPAIE